jgi:beta-lactamase class D
MKQAFLAVIISCVGFFACTPNNVVIDSNIVKMMDSAGMQGTFALMENGTEQFTIANLSRYKDSSYAPLNTFFIVPALIALDKGYINHKQDKWVSPDSTTFYTALIQKIGRTDLLKTIDSIHYGRGIVSANLDKFWKDNSLTITPDEQLGLIKKLYFNELSFQKHAQAFYRKMIVKEDNANYKLSYILSSDTNANNAAWVVGYVEENKHPYFFVLNTNALKGDSLDNQNVQLLKKILLQQGFLKGVR